jgi:hypothetical protein
MLLAATLITIGVLATMGTGEVALLQGALLAGLVPAGCVFVMLVVAASWRTSWRGRQFPRLAAPYSWITATAVILGVLTSVVPFFTGHFGKSTTCGGGYCRYAVTGLMPITPRAYLEDQGLGAIFGGLWALAVYTAALAALRGKVTMQDRWRPFRRR